MTLQQAAAYEILGIVTSDTTRQWALRYNLNVLINSFFLGRLRLALGLGPESLEQITL